MRDAYMSDIFHIFCHDDECVTCLRGIIHQDTFFHTLNDTQVTGPRLNIKTVLSTYGDFHVKDKTAVRTSYL